MKYKKTLSAVLAASLLTGSCITPQAAFAEETPAAVSELRGDANTDSHVDVSDAVLIARFCTQDKTAVITDQGVLNGDVNFDGNLNGDDLTVLLEYIARIRSEFVDPAEANQNFKSVNLTEGIEHIQPEGMAADEVFTDSQLKLAVDLLKHAAQSETEAENLLVSPLSISAALAMTANGAKNETLTEMEKVLGDTLTIEQLNKYYYDWYSKLTDTEKASLQQANSVWIRNGFEVEPAFLQTTADYYKAEAFEAPFDDTTLNDINGWVNTHTKEMIPEILDEISPNAMMYLINALAFEAEWETTYADSAVSVKPFRSYDGSSKNVTMMQSKENCYLEDKYATGFIKPYAEGYSFAAILPKESESVTVGDYIGMLDTKTLKNLLDTRKKAEVTAAIPKFTFDYKIDNMKDMLSDMGMPTAFDDSRADFSGMDPHNSLYISRVIHKTHIAVDEKGTKAAAATVVEMEKQAAVIDAHSVILDRPFIFMILDNNTQLPIFIGCVKSPNEAENTEQSEETQNPEQQALPELKSGEMRFTVVDADTNELITLNGADAEKVLMLTTHIEYKQPEGPAMQTGPIYLLTENPTVTDLAKFLNADVFSLGISEYSLPDGYSLPKEYLTMTEYDNGSADVCIKLKRTE